MAKKESYGEESLKGLYAMENTILGIGNVILSDEGFGVHVVNYLKKNFIFPENFQLIDGGTLGIELMHFITGTKRLLIVDAINNGIKSENFFYFRNEEINKYFTQKISSHEIGIQDLLTILDLTNQKIPCVELIGMQPYSLEAGTDLSPRMKKILPSFANKIVEILGSWGFNIILK